MKAGDLIKYVHYGFNKATIHYGLFLRKQTHSSEWGDIIVLTGEGEKLWTSWQCEVINDDDD